MSTGKWAWNVREGDLVACHDQHGHIRGTVMETAPEIGVVWIRDTVYGERSMLLMQDLLLPDAPNSVDFASSLSQFRPSHNPPTQ
jgi:hypothetical protein